jgi:hypothetical protein
VPPEAITAGLLANEVRIRFEELEESPELETVNRLLDAQDLVEAQTRLTPEAKTAFEAAAISLVAAYTDGNTWLVLAMKYLLAALASNRNATWIGAAALFAVDEESDLVRFGKALAAAEVPPKLVEALAYFVADNVHAPAAKRFIVVISAKLEAGVASRVLRAVKRNSTPTGDDRQLSVIQDIDKLLAPEFELLAPIDEDEFDEDEFDEDIDDFDDDAFDVGPAHFQGPPVKEIRKALLTIGLPKAKVERLTNSQLEQLMALLMQSLAQAPTQAAFNRLERAFMKFGFAPGDLAGLRNGTARPGRAKGLDTCPF